jgi:hypothetical protein
MLWYDYTYSTFRLNDFQPEEEVEGEARRGTGAKKIQKLQRNCD